MVSLTEEIDNLKSIQAAKKLEAKKMKDAIFPADNVRQNESLKNKKQQDDVQSLSNNKQQQDDAQSLSLMELYGTGDEENRNEDEFEVAFSNM